MGTRYKLFTGLGGCLVGLVGLTLVANLQSAGGVAKVVGCVCFGVICLIGLYITIEAIRSKVGPPHH